MPVGPQQRGLARRPPVWAERRPAARHDWLLQRSHPRLHPLRQKEPEQLMGENLR